MNSQLSMKHVHIPSTTKVTGASNKTADNDSHRIENSSKPQQCYNVHAPIQSSLCDDPDSCDCRSEIDNNISNMPSHLISIDPPQNDIHDAAPNIDTLKSHSPLHLVEKGMCAQNGNCECMTISQGKEKENMCQSTAVTDIPNSRGESFASSNINDNIRELNKTDEICGEAFNNSEGENLNENNCNTKVDTSENLTKSPPPRQVSESSSSSSAESKLSTILIKTNSDGRQNGTESMQDSKDGTFEAMEPLSKCDQSPILPLSFSIDVSSALDHVLHEYERDRTTPANRDSIANTSSSEISLSVRRNRPCVLQQSSVVDICSGSTSPSGGASVDGGAAIVSSKLGDKSFSEPPSISVKSSMLVCEESLNRIAQMTAPSKHDSKRSEIRLSNSLNMAGPSGLLPGIIIQPLNVSSMSNNDANIIRTPATKILPSSLEISSSESSKTKVPLITGTAAAKYESMRRRSGTKEPPLSLAKPVSPKPLSPPPVLASAMSTTRPSENDRAKINAAIAKANQPQTLKTADIKSNQRGIDILADITSHATPISNSGPVSGTSVEETIVPIGQSLSVYSAIAAQAGVATRRPVYESCSKQSCSEPQEEIQLPDEPKSVEVVSETPNVKHITVREIGKIRRYCAVRGEFSAWEDLPCQTYGDTEPRRWCELNIDESIEIPLRRGGRLRVFPNFVADGRRDRVAKSMDKCNLYRQYWRRGVENTLESRIQVLLSSKTNRVHDGSSKHGRPGYIYDGVTMMAQPMSRVPEVESLGRDLAELYRLPDKEWNIGANLVCYRTGEDHMAWNSNCEQAEVLILCIIAESKNCTRPILIRPKGHLPLQDGDEEIIVFVGQGDAYEMDGQMQLSYEHCMPKKEDDTTAKRSVVVFRHGATTIVTYDTGSPLYVEQKNAVAEKADSDVHFGHPVRDIPEGKEVFTKQRLIETGAHRSNHRGINGNSKEGCDSIIIENLDPLLREDDGLCWLQVTSSKANGGGALFQSYLSQLPVRVFRSSNLDSRYAPALYVEDTESVLYRYDGLYMVRAMWDEQGHETVHPPTKTDSVYTFFLVRYPKRPVDGTFDREMHYNKISIHELWNEIQKRSGVRKLRLFQIPQPFMELAPVGDKSNLCRKRKENIKLPSEENLRNRKERKRRKNTPSPDQNADGNECNFKQLSSTRRLTIKSDDVKELLNDSKDDSDNGSQRPKRKSAAAARTYLQDAMHNKNGVKDKLNNLMRQQPNNQNGFIHMKQLQQQANDADGNKNSSADSELNNDVINSSKDCKITDEVTELQVHDIIEKSEEVTSDVDTESHDKHSSREYVEEPLTKSVKQVKKRKRPKKEEAKDLSEPNNGLKTAVSKSRFDPSSVQVGQRINVEYKDVLYKATVRRIRLKKDVHQYQIHYDGNRKTNLRWIPPTMVHSIILDSSEVSSSSDVKPALKRQKIAGANPHDSNLKKDVEPQTKFSIGSEVYVEYRKVLYNATIIKSRLSKKSSYEYLVHYDGYKKTADRWVKEESLHEINESSILRFNQQRSPSPKVDEPKEISEGKSKAKQSIQKHNALDQTWDITTTRQTRGNPVLEETTDTNTLDMGDFDAGVEFLPGSCIFVARKDALYLAKMMKRKKVGKEMNYLVHFDDSTSNHDAWVPLSAVYEINPKTRRIFEGTAGKRENLNDDDDEVVEENDDGTSKEENEEPTSKLSSTTRRMARKPAKYDDIDKEDGNLNKSPVKGKKVGKVKSTILKPADLTNIDSGCEFLPGSTIFVEWKNALYLAKMLKKRGKGENMEYFVHYDGYRQSQDSWVPISSVYEINPQTKRAFNNQKK